MNDHAAIRHVRGFRLMLVLALAVRLAALALLIGSDASGAYAYEHGEIARNLLQGNGFSVRLLGAWGLTSQQAPVVPFLLAGCYAVAGAGTSTAHHLFFGLQAVEGVLTVAGAMALAVRVFGPSRRVLLVGAWTALHPTLVYAVTHIQVVSTATMLLVWAFVGLWDIRARPNRRGAAATGLLMGLLALTDPILALAGVGATAAWLLIDRPRSRSEAIRLAKAWAVLVAMSVATLLPWTIRNYRVHGRPVFVKSTFGYAFWQGNNRLSSGTDKVVRASVAETLAEHTGSGLAAADERLWRARHEAGCVDDIALTSEEKLRLGLLSEAARSSELMRRAKEDLAAEPGRYARLSLRRLRYFLWFDETNPKTATPIYRAPHALLTIAAGAGWLLMGSAMRRKLAMTSIAFGLTAAFHALTITAPRFHVPWEPLLIVWATASLCAAEPAWSGFRSSLGRFVSTAFRGRSASTSGSR